MYGRKSNSLHARWRQKSRVAAGMIGGALLITLACVCVLIITDSIGNTAPAVQAVAHG